MFCFLTPMLHPRSGSLMFMEDKHICVDLFRGNRVPAWNKRKKSNCLSLTLDILSIVGRVKKPFTSDVFNFLVSLHSIAFSRSAVLASKLKLTGIFKPKISFKT